MNIVQLIKFGEYRQLSVPKPPLLLDAKHYEQVKKPRRSAKAKGLTTQSDRKKMESRNHFKNGAYSEKPYE